MQFNRSLVIKYISTFLPISHRFIALPAIPMSYLFLFRMWNYLNKPNSSNVGKYMYFYQWNSLRVIGQCKKQFESQTCSTTSKMFIDVVQKYILLSTSNDKINRTDRLPDDSEYICDMCMEKFSQPDKLQQHRANKHSAPTGV